MSRQYAVQYKGDKWQSLGVFIVFLGVLQHTALASSKGEIESSPSMMEMSRWPILSFSNSSGKTQQWTLCQFHSGCSHWSHHCWWCRIDRQIDQESFFAYVSDVH